MRGEGTAPPSYVFVNNLSTQAPSEHLDQPYSCMDHERESLDAGIPYQRLSHSQLDRTTSASSRGAFVLIEELRYCSLININISNGN